MKITKKIFYFFIIYNCTFAFFTENEKSKLFYLTHTNKTKEAINLYKTILQSNNFTHDFEVLQQIANIILQNGIKNEDINMQKAAIIGAGISLSSNSFNILQEGVTINDANIQINALHFLMNTYDDKADESFIKAMSSDFLMTRMEAANILALKKHPFALRYIESLMTKLPGFCKVFFPHFFATLSTPESIKILKQMLNDANNSVRIESILNIARYQIDELLPYIRKKITLTDIGEIEAAAYALGALKDDASIHSLKSIQKTSNENVKLAASKALIDLGHDTSIGDVKKLAEKSNLAAISILGEIDQTEDVLEKLLQNENIAIKLNAAISLLKKKNIKCFPAILEILIKDEKDLMIQPAFTIGHSIMYWNIIPSAAQRKDIQIDPEVSLSIREKILKDTLDLDEKIFIKIVEEIFNNHQNDLIPMLMSLIENTPSLELINILKKHANKPVSSFIKDFCNLSLFKLKEEGPYEDYVINWTKNKKDFPILQLRQQIPIHSRIIDEQSYQLSAEETSKLLIEMYSTIASKKMIEVLIEALKNCENSNKYVLSGLLLRATE